MPEPIVALNGAYVDTFSAGPGCDSIHTVNLSVRPLITSNVNNSICQGDSIWLGGNWRTAAGSYTDTLSAANGCDSIVNTSLSIIPTVTANVNLSICQGDSLLLGGSWQTTSGSYIDVYTGPNGCDSTVVTALSITPHITASATANICQGDSILIGGSWQTTAGNYVDIYPASNGCDSILTTTLTVTPDITNSASAIICQGDSIMLGGSWRTTAGSYVEVYAAANGCDSILTTTVSLLPTASSSTAATICSGDSMLIAGNWRLSGGTYVDTLTAANGCDSLHSVSLNVNPVYNQSASATICQGDSILLGGNWQLTAGTYVDTLQSTSNCDSVVSTTLNVQSITTSSASASICRGDSILLGGTWQNTAGNYVDSLISMAGCDSIHTTTLSLKVVDTAVSISNARLTASATGATYRWIDCGTGQYISGATSRTFAPNNNGVYAVEVTEIGCTDTSSCHLVDDAKLHEGNLPQLQVHPNPTKGVVNIDFGSIRSEVSVVIINAAGKRLREVNLAGEREIQIDLSDWPSSTYYFHVKTEDGSEVLKVVKE
ncbi:MAG: T9SS type A sorting domain-containing protein [Owenweeksia sp.]|nr:T9SS type A sorting domain-containing protein [Owenweeksia sp.]